MTPPRRPIKKVAILGATGALGQVLIPSLQKAGFEVTCVSREGSTKPVQSDAHAKFAEYDSASSLERAFQGQDAVIEAFNPAAAVNQSVVVKAALAAGVVHLITPDYSCDTFNPHIRELMLFEVKIKAQEELERLVAESNGALSWTAIIIGPWYDWATEAGLFWIDKKSRKITRFGSGDQKYSLSRYEATGDMTVAVLKNPEKYHNRPAYFANQTVSTNELIALVNSLGLEGWTVVDEPIDDLFTKGRELWDQDTEKGVVARLGTPAYVKLGIFSLMEEHNRYGADFGDKVEPGWDESEEVLKVDLAKLLA